MQFVIVGKVVGDVQGPTAVYGPFADLAGAKNWIMAFIATNHYNFAYEFVKLTPG